MDGAPIICSGAYNVNQTQIFTNGFLDAFNTVKGGGDSTVMDSLLAGDSRLNPGENGSQMVRRLYTSFLNLNSVGQLAGAIASRIQGTQSVTALAGKPFFLIPYPQYSGGLNVLDSNDFSTYNALEVQLQHRFNSGVAYNLAYTWSKSLDTRSFDPTLTVVGTTNSSTAADTPFDINNRRLNYAPSDFDRRHVLQWNLLYELPFGKGKRWASTSKGLINRVIGGWEVTAYGRLTSGRPFTVFAGTEHGQQRSLFDRQLHWLLFRRRARHSSIRHPGLIWYFNKSQISQFSAPGAGQFGNTGRNAFVGPHYFELDSSFLKRIPVNERIKLELRADATNLTNSVMFSAPTADITSSIFGRINNSVSSASRKIQIGAKVQF